MKISQTFLKFLKVNQNLKPVSYQRIQKTENHHIVERLEYASKPLIHRLVHGRSGKEGDHTFHMKESDSDGIQWDQFNQLELVSFLKIDHSVRFKTADLLPFLPHIEWNIYIRP